MSASDQVKSGRLRGCAATSRFLRSVSGFLFLSAFFLTSPGEGFSQETSIPKTFSAVNYQIEDLTANFYNDKALLVVSGKVRNFGFQAVRGSVIVYLKSKSEQVLVAFENPVNNGAPISYGMDGGFEVSANISGYPQASNVSVEFVPGPSPVIGK
jgi:hypothetical protein